MAYFENVVASDYQTAAVPWVDQTAKVNVSESIQLAEQRFSYDENPDEWITLANTNGTLSYLSARNGVDMAIGGASGDELTIVSKTFFPYNPNTVTKAACSISLDQVANLEMSWGLVAWDGGNNRISDGYLVRSKNGVIEFVKISSAAGGAPVETVVSRSNWIDPADGTTKSRLNLDFTKNQMLVLSHAWYGGGIAELDARYMGKTYPLHKIGGTGADNPTKEPIIGNPNLALIYSIKALDTVVAPPSLIIYGISVEANSKSPVGKAFACESGAKTITGGSYVPIMSLRLKTTFKGKQNNQGYITKLRITITSTDRLASVGYAKDASLTGASFGDLVDFSGTPITTSMVERDITASAGNGTPRQLQVVPPNTTAFFEVDLEDIISVYSDGSASDTITIFAQLLTGGSGKVQASASWLEIY